MNNISQGNIIFKKYIKNPCYTQTSQPISVLQSPGSKREGQVLQLVMLPEEYLHFHIAIPKTGVAFLSPANQAPGSGDLVFPQICILAEAKFWLN